MLSITRMAMVLAGGLSVASAAQASSYKVIYNFTGAPDGATPRASLIMDAQGRLYGTTTGGGAAGDGTIFRLTRPTGGLGPWTEEILHSFVGSDGISPDSALLLEPSGELYGTTVLGGATNRGVIYRLDNLPGWPITVLRSFLKSDGEFSHASLVLGPYGLLYSSTPQGALRNGGTALNISPLGDTAEYATLIKFAVGLGGKNPSGLVISGGGKLVGVAASGGAYNQGTAFALTLSGNVWRQTTLYSFGSSQNDVASPVNPLIVGKGPLAGMLIGCDGGGTHAQGAVFTLSSSSPGTGPAAEAIIYNFGHQANDPDTGSNQTCGLTQDPSGKLYGLTSQGGTTGVGAFFELDPPVGGKGMWSETVLYSFNLIGDNGLSPSGAPLRAGGTFFGTAPATSNSQPTNSGTVWELTP